MKSSLFHKGNSLDVDVIAVVDTNGLVKEARISKPDHAEFDENALAVVKTYRFKPAMQDGKPVAMKIMVVVGFRALGQRVVFRKKHLKNGRNELRRRYRRGTGLCTNRSEERRGPHPLSQPPANKVLVGARFGSG